MLKTTEQAMLDYYRNLNETHWQKVEEKMAQFAAAQPCHDALNLRQELYRQIAAHARPQLFRGNPFFFELGMRYRHNWGIPEGQQPNSWLLRHQPEHSAAYRDCAVKLWRYSLGGHDADTPVLWNIYNAEGFDTDHHCLGYSRILPLGVKGVDRQIAERECDSTLTAGQRAELAAMRVGLAALLAIAARFADSAEAEAELADPAEAANLRRIAATARRIPAEAPRSFYEGLAAMIFYREVIATLEGVGISSLGRPDLLLIGLYRQDLADGVLDEAAARDLIRHWLIVHDIKTAAREREWPETSTCLELGGCDADGREVFNELTRFFIEEHAALKLLNPKLNCRYSSSSPDEYLTLMAQCVLDGHNQFAWLNDDVLIPAQLRYGKSLVDARNYVNGGCQETICEGVEHSAGGFFYINMPGCLHAWFIDQPDSEPGLREIIPDGLRGGADFDDLYHQWLKSLSATIATVTGWAAHNGACFRHLAPGPLFSTALAGCVESACDYTAGGARYSPTGVTLVGFADIVNALFALKRAVYVEKFVDLPTYTAAVRADWGGEFAGLRQRILALPRFGYGDAEVDALAARFSTDITAAVRNIRNERGAWYQPSYFVYWAFKWFGDLTGATPDGRRRGEYLAQGISPARSQAPQSVTDVVRSLGVIDFRDVPGNAVWDWQLPFGADIGSDAVVAVMREAARNGIPTIQPNCVDVETLLQAQQRPESHSDLVVRISGLSAVFVKLNREVQDEIICRSRYADQ